MLATPASADVPADWPTEEIDSLNAILLLVGVPLLLFVGISFLVYVPSIIRGERIAPGAAGDREPVARRSAQERR